MTTSKNKTCRSYNFLFKIVRILGNGSFATCYEVHSNEGEGHSKVMACKVIQNKGKEHDSVRKENAILKGLCHQNIIRWIDFYSDEINSYIFTELCEEGDMYDVVWDRYPLSDSMSRSLLFQAFDAIDFIHKQGIIHRDIKPENFFITADFNVKLGDFGQAIEEKYIDNSDGLIIGTPGYLSPEMVRGSPYGKATDIWSFGCLTYFVLTKRPLEFPTFVTTKTYKIPKNINKYGSDLIKQLLVVDPRERLTSIKIKTHPFFKDVNLKDNHISESLIDMKESFASNANDRSSSARGGKNIFLDKQENNIAYFSSSVPSKCFARKVC